MVPQPSWQQVQGEDRTGARVCTLERKRSEEDKGTRHIELSKTSADGILSEAQRLALRLES